MINLFLTAPAAEENPLGFLPSMESMVAHLESLMRIAVLAGPLCLLGLGLWYLLAPAKEANHLIGFRCWWGMASVEVWQFTQRLAGLVWTGVGLVMTIVMAIICNGYRELAPDQMAFSALKLLGWEVGIVLVTIIAINIALVVLFDQKGYRRTRTKR